MKRNTLIIAAFALIVSLSSCEEVVDLNLEEGPTRLVIEASIAWVKDTPGNLQQITLSQTSSYYDSVRPPAPGAVVSITDEQGRVFRFQEEDTPGLYVCAEFIPVLNNGYTLSIWYENNEYRATETLKPVPGISRIEQAEDGGFTRDQKVVRLYFMDDADVENYYLVAFRSPHTRVPEIDVLEDRFSQGNELSDGYNENELAAGEVVEIRLEGISKMYFNYMSLLFQVAGSGNPFDSTPAMVRGNIVNLTDRDKYGWGFFRLSEVDTATYVFR